MIRPLDRHLDSDELDALIVSQALGVSVTGRLSEDAVREAQRHVESCQDCDQKVQMHRSAQSAISLRVMSGQTTKGPDCPQESDWVRFAAGLLEETEAKERMNHAAKCGHCGPLLKAAARNLSDETTPDEDAALAKLTSARPEWRKNMAATLRDSVRDRQSAPSWWSAVFAWPTPAYAFAGIVAVALVAWIGVRALQPPSAEQLLAQAYSERRTLEVRIPGAKHAPLRIERGDNTSNLDKPEDLLKAEALIAANLGKKPNDPKWLQLKARADLLDGNYDSAIRALNRASQAEPDSVPLLTDLGSAYFLRAEGSDRPLDYGKAIEVLGKALAKSPEDPVALFNRALASEKMLLVTQAVDDWEHYLRIDPNSGWADEARSHLAVLRQKLQERRRSEIEPLLQPADLVATESGIPALAAKIDQRIEKYLDIAITDWLPQAYPVRNEKGPPVADVREALSLVAKVAARSHHDSWLSNLLLHSTAPNFALGVAELSLSLKANNTGDNVRARQHALTAKRFFFQAHNEAGERRAELELTFAAHDAGDAVGCIRSIRGIDQLMSHSPYLWLRTQFRLEEGICFWLAGNLGQTQKLFMLAEADATAGGYPVVYLRSQNLLSGLSTEGGDFTASAARTQSALNRFWSGEYPAMSGYDLYYNIYEFSRLTKQPHLQMAAWRDALVLSEDFVDNVLRAMAHSAMADAAIAAGFPAIAESEFAKAGQLFAASPQIDSTHIARIEAETRLAAVEASLGHPNEAVARLQTFTPEVSHLSDTFMKVLFYTVLGDAESRIGEDKEAAATLDRAKSVAELELLSIHDTKSRIEWEERASDTYRELTQLQLDHGDAQSALEVWESFRGAARRTRNANPGTHSENVVTQAVATQLPLLKEVTVISYAVLPKGLVAWVSDDRGVFSRRIDVKRSEVESSADQFRNLCSDPHSDLGELQQVGHRLYSQLVQPVRHYLIPGRALVVEPDDFLSGLPFEALVDENGHYFGEHEVFNISPGIFFRRNALVAEAIDTNATVLVAAVPISKSVRSLHMTPLPDVLAEGELVAGEFSSPHLLTANNATTTAILSALPSAAVFHFAGHAFNSPQESGLLLSDNLLSAASIENVSLPRLRLVVLSACDTQGNFAYGADSLVRVLLQAGVPDVVASRWSVDSAATREFMGLFYRALVGGNTPKQAIHLAQSELRSLPNMAHPYYWSAFGSFGLV